MRFAALYDIHGNLPALEAVLRDVRQADVDQIVVGGDVVPGPMARDALKRLLDLDLPTHFIRGNGELAILAQMTAARTGSVTYWGHDLNRASSGKYRRILSLDCRTASGGVRAGARAMAETLQLEIDGLGEVLFCHSTPRSETEVFTRLTAEDRLLPIFEGLDARVVVCGHTHMQFDRMIGQTRVVNAGSVGMPFGEAGGYWLLLGPGIELCRTPYDLGKAAERIRATSYPQAQEFADENVLQPPLEKEMLEAFAKAELK